MALLDLVRKSLTLTSHYTDDVLQGLIDAALADMRRVGVRPELLEADGEHPMVVFACVAFTQAYYNMNHTTSPVWEKAYTATVTSLMNSNLSDYIDWPQDGSQDGSEDGSGESGDDGAATPGLGLGLGLGMSGGGG